VSKLTIHCPPMPVRNTSWLGNPFADRLTDDLPCTGKLEAPDGKVVPFNITFPPCRVRRIADLAVRIAVGAKYGIPTPPAVWMVAAVVAKPKEYTSVFSWTNRTSVQVAPFVRLSFPEEPTVRRRDGSGLIDVLPVDSWDGIVKLPDGREGFATATLPRCVSRPQTPFGLFQYLVDAVDMEGTVKWL
jgi:hypothetical protein